MLKLLPFLLLLIASHALYASEIILHKTSATVWYPGQGISGKLIDFPAGSITVHHNQRSFAAEVDSSQQFSFTLTLLPGKNTVWVIAAAGELRLSSDTIQLSLGYRPAPLVRPLATVSGNQATLRARTLENPGNAPLHYYWSPDARNPAPSQIQQPQDSVARVTIPDTPGNYHFNLLVRAGNDSTWFQTLVIRTPDELRAFNIDSDPPTWMRDAVMYQITPHSFVAKGTYDDIRAKLPDLHRLGVNTLWLQPVFGTANGGQGYDITDYFALRPDLGTEAQLQQLITEARSRQMRVLFDFVPNHTSIHHPYARDCIEKGPDSHYYTYYQRENDGAAYSSFYTPVDHGFITYFWKDLVNLNYANPEVQRWMLEAFKHWVRKFDIDGYRVDAVWGVNARQPSFSQRLRTELKSIKPDLLLLAEDKASDPEVFTKGFDLAYDWAADTSWVSQWSWEYEYDEQKSRTIFNAPPPHQRGVMLREALFRNGSNPHLRLRFMENNDLHRFGTAHSPAQTRMVAALLFALPGIPMLYNGQEIGASGHPYSTKAVFTANKSIRAQSEGGLFRYYRKLIRKRMKHPALRDTSMREITAAPGESVVAFQRPGADENFIVLINLDSTATQANIDFSELNPQPTPNRKICLNDVLNKGKFRVRDTTATSVTVPLQGYQTRWLRVK
jgi:cyclomaltodextrinase / maltogenic alpha-amylase / neopullulanase